MCIYILKSIYIFVYIYICIISMRLQTKDISYPPQILAIDSYCTINQLKYLGGSFLCLAVQQAWSIGCSVGKKKRWLKPLIRALKSLALFPCGFVGSKSLFMQAYAGEWCYFWWMGAWHCIEHRCIVEGKDGSASSTFLGSLKRVFQITTVW